MGSPAESHRATVAAVAALAALIALREVTTRPLAGPTEPAVLTLLRERAQDDRGQRSPFFAALSSLARRNGGRLEDYAGRFVDGGFAVEAGAAHVIVALEGWDHSIPGRDARSLLLFDRRGRLLDRLSCEINGRLTRVYPKEDSGVFRTEVPARPERDGALLVIRYTPEPGGVVGGNFSHEIGRGGSWHTFPWGQQGPGHVGPAEWLEKGLCRVTVRDGLFAVLFPRLPPDGEVRTGGGGS